MSSQLPNTTLKYWLAFTAIPELGPLRFQKILTGFPSILEAWQAPASALVRAGLEPSTAEVICKAKSFINPETELHTVEKLGLSIVTIIDNEYPTLLKTSFAPPPVLYYRGALPKNETALGVVGSRKMSSYGKQVTEKISATLARAGIAIISGLALGVDACAHQTTLDNKGKTFAILGNGLHTIYPRTNDRLARTIIERGGGIISEFAPGTPPFKSNFPQRNRLIAGLSRGVVITEAAERSGALITARFALEFGRDVFAVPGDINRETSMGANELIKRGAAVVTTPEDILQAWDIAPTTDEQKNTIELTEQEKQIISILHEPMHVDKIARLARLDISTTNAVLTILEIKNITVHCGGNTYAKR